MYDLDQWLSKEICQINPPEFGLAKALMGINQYLFSKN